MAGRDITHEARATSLVSNRALVKEDAHNHGDEQNSVTESGGVREKGRGAKRVRAELDPVKSSNSSFFCLYLGQSTLAYWICMANGSLRAVVYAKGIQMGLTPGFQSSKFTQMSKQTRLYRDLLAPLLPGLQQCL